MSNYKQNIDEYLERNGSDEALICHSRYNYDLHEREKLKAEKARNNLTITIGILLLIILAAVGFLGYVNMIQKMKLAKALSLIQTIIFRMYEHRMIDIIKSEKLVDFKDAESDSLNELPIYATSKKQILKQKLLSKLRLLVQTVGDTPNEDRLLHKHKVIEILNKKISNNENITQCPHILKELEEAVLDSCPEFKLRLMILTLDKMTSIEFEVAMLIRAGIQPKDMAILLDRTKSAITDRRRSLTKKIFGNSANNHDLDILISNL